MNDTKNNVLDPDCIEAWNAYNDMFKSKSAHFDFMEVLENKKRKFNLSPTDADKVKLAALLETHNVEVKRFTSVSMELKNSNPDAHRALFEYIAEIAHSGAEENTQH